MAKNLKKDNARFLTNVAATQPATPVSGDPVLIGQIPGVALTDEGDGGNDSGNISVDTGGIYELTVEAKNNAGNSAVAVGDILYYDQAETIKINKDATNGVRFGYAMAVIASGANAAINVKVGY